MQYCMVKEQYMYLSHHIVQRSKQRRRTNVSVRQLVSMTEHVIQCQQTQQLVLFTSPETNFPNEAATP